MQFIVDESTGRAVIEHLRSAGHRELLLRLRDESAANRVRVVMSVLEKYADRLTGNFVVATERGVRIRSGK